MLRRSGASPNGPIQVLRLDPIAPGIFVRTQLRTLRGNLQPRHNFLDIEIAFRRVALVCFRQGIRCGNLFALNRISRRKLNGIVDQLRELRGAKVFLVQLFGQQIVLTHIFKPAVHSSQRFGGRGARVMSVVGGCLSNETVDD